MSRRIAMFAGGAAVVLLLAWFLLLWSPKGGELDKARQRKTAAEQQVNELQVRVDRLKDAKAHEPQLIAVQDRLKSAVPDKADLANFILDANSVAEKTGVDFISIAPTPPAASPVAGSPSVVAVQVNANGDYGKMMNFLQELLDLPRVVVIDSIQLHPGGDNGELTAALTGHLLTSQAPAGLPDATATAAATTGSTTTTTVAK